MDNDKYNADGLDKMFHNSNTNMKVAIGIIKYNEKTWWTRYKYEFSKAFSLDYRINKIQ